MGYTHYWTQPLRYSKAEWTQICEDVTAILNDVQHVQGIPLANGMGELGTQPIINGETILFNGAGDEDSHEAVHIQRIVPPLTEEDKRWGKWRGWDFCKTARKPYDIAVTAVLAYLATLDAKPLSVSSDGDGREWLEGVALARRCIPRRANQIDIPMPIMKSDRWDWHGRYGSVTAKHFDAEACIDGAFYVFDVRDESRCYRFPTWTMAHDYFNTFREKPCKVRYSTPWSGDRIVWENGGPLFNATGSFDKARHARIEREQTRILKALIDCAKSEGRNIRPPAFARPNEMAGVPKDQEAPSLADLYKLCEAA